MLTILKKTTNKDMSIEERLSNGCWVNVISPAPDEIAQLEAWGIPPEMITYALDMDEMSRTERDDEFTLILMRIPFFQGHDADVPYTTLPLGIILSNSFMVTICKVEHPILKELTNGHVRSLSTTKRNRLILHIFFASANRYLSYLRQINKMVDALEDNLQVTMRNKELVEMLKYQKSLVYFTTALRSNELMLERLRRAHMFKQYEEDLDLLEDVLTENQQAITMTEIARNILTTMLDTFASMISNNLNVVMRVLAGLTIFLSIPTIVFSFYGMNVALPLMDHPLAFGVAIMISLFLILIVGIIFTKRDWL